MKTNTNIIKSSELRQEKKNTSLTFWRRIFCIIEHVTYVFFKCFEGTPN